MRINRLNEVEHYVYKKGFASMEEIAEHFNTSMSTVRRDISDLLKTGSVKKVYGGVKATKTVQGFDPIDTADSEEKQHIAKLAADSVKQGSTIFLDSGYTVSLMVPYLKGKNVVVVTNSFRVIEQATKLGITLFALSGFYNEEISAFVGFSVQEGLKQIAFDYSFLSCKGISVENGLTVSGFYEEPIKRAVVDQTGERTTILVEHSKFDKSALFSFSNFDKIHTIITDLEPNKNYMDYFKKKGIEIIY